MRIAAPLRAQHFPQLLPQLKRGGSRRRTSSRWIRFLFATSSDLLRAWPGASRFSTVQARPASASKVAAVTTETTEPSCPDLASLEREPACPTARVPSYRPAASASIADTRPACCAE